MINLLRITRSDGMCTNEASFTTLKENSLKNGLLSYSDKDS